MEKLVRYSIFELPLLIILLGSKHSLAIGKWPKIKFLISKLTFNSRFWISNCQFDIRSSIFDIRTTAFFILLGSKNLLWHSESYRIIFLISKLTFNARFWISNCQFVIRYSIFELPLFFVFLWSKTFFSNRNVTEYQVFNIKTNF